MNLDRAAAQKVQPTDKTQNRDSFEVAAQQWIRIFKGFSLTSILWKMIFGLKDSVFIRLLLYLSNLNLTFSSFAGMTTRDIDLRAGLEQCQ